MLHLVVAVACARANYVGSWQVVALGFAQLVAIVVAAPVIELSLLWLPRLLRGYKWRSSV